MMTATAASCCPRLVEMGIDLLNPIQWRCGDWDLGDLKARFGTDLCFHSAVDNQQTLPFGTPEDVRREVRMLIQTLAPTAPALSWGRATTFSRYHRWKISSRFTKKPTKVFNSRFKYRRPVMPETKRRLKRSESFLGIHFDFHAGDDNNEIGKYTTPEMIAEVMRKVQPDYIQCDCKGHRGFLAIRRKLGIPPRVSLRMRSKCGAQ